METAPILVMTAVVAVSAFWLAARLTGSPPTQPAPHALFFHPFHAAGGGGERVLWVAVRGLLDRGCRVSIVSASGARNSRDLVYKQFGVEITDPEFTAISFLSMPFTKLLDNHIYPTAAVLLQNLAAAVLFVYVVIGAKISRLFPTIFIDTTGFAFTLPIAKILLRCRTVAYVHYPTMPREKLAESAPVFKSLYYRSFVTLYEFAGRFVDVALTNSKWTDERMRQTWRRQDTAVMYPPVKLPTEASLKTSERQEALLSVGQFRPEKNHALQLRVFAAVKRSRPSTKFWIVGGARDEQDLGRVQALEILAKELQISDSVEFLVNVPRAEVERRLASAKIAIHTMVDEHFGISILEFLASGVLVVAHKSGGPEKDILLNNAGFLASSEHEYVALINRAFEQYNKKEMQSVINAGHDTLRRFNDDSKFAKIFADLIL